MARTSGTGTRSRGKASGKAVTQRSSTRPAKKPTKKVAKAKAGAKAKAKVTTAKKAIKAKPTKSAAGNGSSEPQIVEARPPAELPIPVSTFFF